jgi:hypothetical protein
MKHKIKRLALHQKVEIAILLKTRMATPENTSPASYLPGHDDFTVAELTGVDVGQVRHIRQTLYGPLVEKGPRVEQEPRDAEIDAIMNRLGKLEQLIEMMMGRMGMRLIEPASKMMNGSGEPRQIPISGL